MEAVIGTTEEITTLFVLAAALLTAGFGSNEVRSGGKRWSGKEAGGIAGKEPKKQGNER